MQFQSFSLTFYKNDEKIYENTYKNLALANNIFRFNLFDFDTILNIQEQYFIRENEEYIFKLDIKNNSSSLKLKAEDLEFYIIVDLCDLKIQNNIIILEYVIETDDFKNKIVIEKSEE